MYGFPVYDLPSECVSAEIRELAELLGELRELVLSPPNELPTRDAYEAWIANTYRTWSMRTHAIRVEISDRVNILQRRRPIDRFFAALVAAEMEAHFYEQTNWPPWAPREDAAAISNMRHPQVRDRWAGALRQYERCQELAGALPDRFEPSETYCAQRAREIREGRSDSEPHAAE